MADGKDFIVPPPRDEFECAGFDVTDEFLEDARLVAYMYGQVVTDPRDEERPYNPKTFPEKAVDIIVKKSDDFIVEIFLDTATKSWDSRFRYGGELCRLGPDQMGQFFGTEFYRKLEDSLRKMWPLSDKEFGEMYEAVLAKRMKVDPTGFGPEELEEADDDQVFQPGKRADLANQDTTGDGERDYSSTGRKIIKGFGDMETYLICN